MGDLNFELNRLAGTTGLDAAGAANSYAGTVGKELVGALNSKAGTTGLELVGVANKLAGTTGLDLLKALQAIATFTPTQITGLVGWWDASLASTITGSPVTQWNDRSTSGYNLTASGTARPATGGTLNSLNVLTFDGSSDILRNLTVSVSAGNVGTWIAVLKPSSVSPTNNGRILTFQKNGDTEWSDATSISAMNRSGGTAGVSAFYGGSERAIVSVTDDAAHVVVTQRNGDSAASWRDGTAGATNTSLGTTNFAFNFMSVAGEMDTAGAISPGSFWAGDIGEILWYNAAISTANRQLVEAYLKAKWGTP